MIIQMPLCTARPSCNHVAMVLSHAVITEELADGGRNYRFHPSASVLMCACHYDPLTRYIAGFWLPEPRPAGDGDSEPGNQIV